MFLRFLKVLPLLLVPLRTARDPIAQVDTDSANYDAVWLPADHAGPIVAAPLDDHIFKD